MLGIEMKRLTDTEITEAYRTNGAFKKSQAHKPLLLTLYLQWVK